MSLIKKVYSWLVISNIKEMDEEPNVDEWLNYLSRLPQPKDCIDYSYNKYKCRAFHFPMHKRFILNLVSFPIAFMSYIAIFKRKKSLIKCKEEKLLIERKADLDYHDILPDKLTSQFVNVEEVLDARAYKEKISVEFSYESANLYRKVILKHPFSFYYQVWASRELSKHCKYIMDYNPSAIAVYVEERNIASPLLKQLYESTGRRYISFMHGEYLLRLIQGYMAFSEYYIWDDEYYNVFKNVLHCDIDKYTLYTPKKLEKKWNFDGIEPEYLCTYYFSAESKESIQKLSEIYRMIELKGYKCKVRPHPRYSQWEYINNAFSAEQIEDNKSISIEESLKNTKYVVGLATTVLAEGYFEGKEIVVDDITSPEKYANLSKRNFIVLKRPHILLSELIESIGVKI